jgi:hypothetical protein
MKHIREKRELELKRIVRDLYRLKKNHDNNVMMITFDYLYMKVRQMQNNGLLYEIQIPSKEDYQRLTNGDG